MSKENWKVGRKPRENDVLKDKSIKYFQKERVNNGVKHY